MGNAGSIRDPLPEKRRPEMLARRSHSLVAVPASVAGLLMAGAASAQSYEVTDLGAIGQTNVPYSLNQQGDVAGFSRFLDGTIEGFVYAEGDLRYVGFLHGGPSSSVVGINNLGHGVGRASISYHEFHAFVWVGHKIDLGTLGGEWSYGESINDLGQAVGTSELSDLWSTRAFVWEDGEMYALPTLGGDHASGFWINNNGQIVGGASDDTGSGGAVLWEDGEIYRLPPDNGYGHLAWYIHDNGDIAGQMRFERSGEVRWEAVIWRDREVCLELGTLADGTPGEDFAVSTAFGINADGVVVGLSTSATGGGEVVFVYRDGVMVELNDLLPDPWKAYNIGQGCINDAGQIVVEAGTGFGATHAVLLTPIDSCPADIDGSGDVDIPDLLALLAAWGPCPGCPEDIDGDGVVDIVDLLELLGSWGPCP
jgi:probable HAF family extracellular repeat protein